MQRQQQQAKTADPMATDAGHGFPGTSGCGKAWQMGIHRDLRQRSNLSVGQVLQRMFS
jgi:hypothetical protein